MDGGDRWRVITCAAADNDRTIINRIMLRFRPIAPKPVDGGSSSGRWKPENKSGSVAASGRTKRKYVRVKKSQRCLKRRNKTIPSSSDQGRGSDPTLQLLTQETDQHHVFQDSVLADAVGSGGVAGRTVVASNKVADRLGGLAWLDRTLETSVTVESVADTCIDRTRGTLGSTDAERMKNLEEDTCPGFISDGLNRVRWVNDAYRKMVTAAISREKDGLPPQAPEVTIRLVIKDEKTLPPYGYPNYASFTCWVRLQDAWRKDRCSSSSQMVPCDVWRMEFGGFAWRLDVKAALSLGL